MRNELLFIFVSAVSLSVHSLATFAAESEPSHAQVCQTIEISELYANPMTYDGTLVCTEALVLVSYWGMDLLEGRLAGYVHTPVDITAPISFWEALERGYRTYYRVRVSGRFTALEFCIDLYDPALPIQEQEGCMPSGFPFTFEDGVIERIEVVARARNARRLQSTSSISTPFSSMTNLFAWLAQRRGRTWSMCSRLMPTMCPIKLTPSWRFVGNLRARRETGPWPATRLR